MFSCFFTNLMYCQWKIMLLSFFLSFWQVAVILSCYLLAFAKIIKTSRYVFFNIVA